MVNNIADWLCNVMIWTAIITFVALLYETFVSRGFLDHLANPVNGLIAVAVVGMLSALWPKF
jgi:hypothetical protein